MSDCVRVPIVEVEEPLPDDVDVGGAPVVLLDIDVVGNSDNKKYS